MTTTNTYAKVCAHGVSLRRRCQQCPAPMRTQYVFLLFKDTTDFDPSSELVSVHASLTSAKIALRTATEDGAVITQQSTTLWSAKRRHTTKIKYEEHWIEKHRVQR